MAVLGFSSLAASRVMDDEAFLQDPDKYKPYPPHDRIVQRTVKKTGVAFCVDRGEWKLMMGDVCERVETPTDRINRQLEQLRKTQAEAARFARLRKMTGEELYQFREKKRHELLSGPRIVTRWDVALRH